MKERIVGVLPFVALVLGAPFAWLIIFPKTSGRFSMWPVVAHALSFPVLLGAIGVALALGMFALRLWWRRKGRRSADGWAVAGVMWCIPSIALLAFPAAMPGTGNTDLGKSATSLTVVTWNTADELTPTDFAQLIADTNPDIMVLPETDAPKLRDALAATGEWASGAQTFSSNGDSTIATTSIIVQQRVGTYHEVPGVKVTFGAITVAPAEGSNLPTIVGIHTAPPIPGLMSNWQADVATVAKAAKAGGNRIVAGDFNATLRHGDLVWREGYVDVGAAACRRAGTWPSRLPSWLGAPIDHILISGKLTPMSCHVPHVGKSDHYPLIAKLGIEKS